MSYNENCDHSRLNVMTTWEGSIQDTGIRTRLVVVCMYISYLCNYPGRFADDMAECSPANHSHSDGGFLISKCLKMSENYTEPVSRLGKYAVTVWSRVYSHLSMGTQNGRCHGHCSILGRCITNYYFQETITNEFNE
jgi:hypothetical protein